MGYGLEVHNDGGFLQVSSDYPCQQVIASGTVTYVGGIVFDIPSSGLVTSGNQDKIMVWVYPNIPPTGDGGDLEFMARCYFLRQNTLNTVRIGFKKHGTTEDDLLARTGGGLKYILTVEPQYAVLTDDYGLNVFNEGGVLTYTSELALPQITSMAGEDPTTNFIIHSHPSDTHPYFLLNSFYPTELWEFVPVPPEPTEIFSRGPILEFAKVGSNFETRAEFGEILNDTGDLGPITTFDRPYGYAAGVGI